MDRDLRGKARYPTPSILGGKGPLSPIIKRPLRKRETSHAPILTKSVESLRKIVPLLEPKPVLGIGFGALADVQLSHRDLKPLTTRRAIRRKTSISPMKKALQVVNFPASDAPIHTPEPISARKRLLPTSLSRSFLRLPGAHRRYFPVQSSKHQGDYSVLRAAPKTCVTDRTPSTSLFHNASIREKCLL